MNTPYESARFKLVTKADAAQVFSVCTKTIDNYIKAGLIPPPFSSARRSIGIRRSSTPISTKFSEKALPMR